MREFSCSLVDGSGERFVPARNAREAAKRYAWGSVQGRVQSLEYVVVVLVDGREFRVRISIYPHFDIHEKGCNTFLEDVVNK